MKFVIKSVLIVFFGMFLILTSCAKKKSSSQSRLAGAPRGTTNTPVSNLGVAKCSDGTTSAAGRIFDDTATGDSFRMNWSNFFSAIMADDQLGSLSGSSTNSQQGVNIQLRIRIVNNQLSLSETSMNIVVSDSFVDQKNPDTGEIIQPIKMGFTTAESGSQISVNNGTGNFTIVFADKYGKVTVTGSFNQSQTQGTVSFQNTAHYNNETPKSGNLGRFALNTCGLFF